MIPESDALAACSSRDARALLALSDSAARAAAIAEAADEPAEELERARAASKLAAIFASVKLHTPPRTVRLERRVPDIALATCAPYVCAVLFEQATDHANVLFRLGLSPYFT
jgi:hypothetical protein